MQYLSCHVAYLLWLLTIPFQAFHVFLPFYDFWAVMCMLGNQEGVRGISYPLETWHALESGPRYLCSGCRVRRLRTTVLGTKSFTFGRGSRWLSPLFQYDVLILNFEKSKYYPSRGGDISHGGCFSEDFFESDLLGISSYTGYLELCGVPQVTLELCGIPQIILELCRVPRIILELCGVPRVTLELCWVPRIMRGTSNYAGVISLIDTWRSTTFSFFSPNTYTFY